MSAPTSFRLDDATDRMLDEIANDLSSERGERVTRVQALRAAVKFSYENGLGRSYGKRGASKRKASR